MVRALLVALVVILALARPVAAAPFVFNALPLNCAPSGSTHECFDLPFGGGVASGLQWGLSPFVVPAFTLIEQMTVFGMGPLVPAFVFSAFDLVTQFPFPPFEGHTPVPLAPIAAVGGCAQHDVTLYGFHSSPFFTFQQSTCTLANPILLSEPGIYFLAVFGVVLRNPGFPSYFPNGSTLPSSFAGISPSPDIGLAFQLVGQTVPEPATLLLVGAGALALRMRRRRG